ncbi:anti-sigma regulatory factor [Anabaena cylindrica FACHB-243]|uniref:Anti-sigma regulatory factor, serine/threonine protein kinase n=1 Tax=Anabaena cylindrica (strain ATCC 27899 / PCC 7122) TaxID=272123 RepID=K9ZG48_ANACC|nr:MULTISPECIES: anti-sigma regulatory factor [Anabaena]AFZ58171.1 putative anti-sigma regulatory factor, serine/threonine protein kinase [Anabaena cylindrica PCC 7122]MBD2419053.1 anti-sigma regulatory factor [Anabaena cylindrica FACHB-243]MBY5281201.1 anti-sigma regulatory factor [Anabaena sp. CCAP 1446/1C]MBY5310270.1 anti-sigma regulatory factor [Anabaena sp. CCAP 1446/1C]MCM2409522.1 anti-sigma regulatory factor [Anabaena sp. CCAP 1446/1C]
MKSELHVPSDLIFVNIVEAWLLGCLKIQMGESVDWSAQSSRLRLALVEAYTNTVRHAHKNQPHLPILLRLELKDHKLLLEIWDYGQGFDMSTYFPPDPTEKKEGGYGWLIMNRLMDKVEYQLQINGANCLKLEATLPKD